jgi:type IV pilus assembly protein PilC
MTHSSTTVPPFGSARLPGRETTRKPRPVWRLYAFDVTRRASKVMVGAPVRPRRVYVFAPSPDAANAGAGAGRDEGCKPSRVHLWDYLRVRRATREDVSEFYDTLGNALATGSGMSLALNMAARMCRSAKMRGVIGALHYHVAHGEDLHIAMRGFPEVFSTMQIAMVESAAATGLDKAGALLITLSERLQKDGKIWAKFVAALAYPVSLLGLTLVATIVLEIWALPPMAELFRTLGGQLPPVTQAFYDCAQFLRSHAVGLLGAAVGSGVLLGIYARRILSSRFVQRASIRTILIGPIVQSLALVRALGTFVLLKQSGAKVRDQFSLAAAASGNCVVAEFFEACYARISLGESVEESFMAERHRLGDDGARLAGKMEVGMAGADLGSLINRVIADLNDRAETRLALLPNLLRWPLLTICCALIGTVALAIVLPYPNLIADVAHQQIQIAK